MASYEWRHVVGFDETSLVGNVYFSHYLAWQGHCRERFLFDHAREVVTALERREVAFFTRSCACEFIGDRGFTALDEVLVRMRLARFRGGRMTLEFAYAHQARPDVLVASGVQEVHCKAQHGGEWVPEPYPPALLRALLGFAGEPELRAALEEALAFHAERAQRATRSG